MNAQTSTHTFAVISDTHIPENSQDTIKVTDGWDRSVLRINPTENARRTLTRLSEYAERFNPDSLIHLGDIGDNRGLATENSYRSWNSLLSDTYFKAKPFYGALGNHDSLPALSQLVDLGPREPFDDKSKLAYEFRMGSTRCVMLDAKINTGASGEIDQDQIEWLVEKLSRTIAGEKMLIFCHFPFLEETIPWHKDLMLVKNGEQLHQSLVPFADRVLAVFSGHAHYARTAVRDGISYLAIPSSSYPFRADPGADDHKSVVDTRLGKLGFDIFTIVHRMEAPPILTRQSFQTEFSFERE